MDVKKVQEELEKIERFKNMSISYNEEKNIYDIYVKIKGDEENTQDILNNIENLEYQYCSFCIFEIWFSPENETSVIKALQKNFK